MAIPVGYVNLRAGRRASKSTRPAPGEEAQYHVAALRDASSTRHLDSDFDSRGIRQRIGMRRIRRDPCQKRTFAVRKTEYARLSRNRLDHEALTTYVHGDPGSDVKSRHFRHDAGDAQGKTVAPLLDFRFYSHYLAKIARDAELMCIPCRYIVNVRCCRMVVANLIFVAPHTLNRTRANYGPLARSWLKYSTGSQRAVLTFQKLLRTRTKASLIALFEGLQRCRARCRAL